MKNSTLLNGEKIYLLNTVNQDGHHETHDIAAFNLKEAKKIKSEIIGNSRDGAKAVGQLRLKK